jgi:hypothetical protein
MFKKNHFVEIILSQNQLLTRLGSSLVFSHPNLTLKYFLLALRGGGFQTLNVNIKCSTNFATAAGHHRSYSNVQGVDPQGRWLQFQDCEVPVDVVSLAGATEIFFSKFENFFIFQDKRKSGTTTVTVTTVTVTTVTVTTVTVTTVTVTTVTVTTVTVLKLQL